MDRDNRSTKNDNITKCEHATAEWLGSNNTMAFLRCLTCRSVIVTQAGLRVAIPPAQATV